MIIGLAAAILATTLFGHAAEGFKGIEVFQTIANDIVENRAKNFKKIDRWDLIKGNVVELAKKAKLIIETIISIDKEPDLANNLPQVFVDFSNVESEENMKEYMKTIKKLSVGDRRKLDKNIREMKKLLEKLLNSIESAKKYKCKDIKHKSKDCQEIKKAFEKLELDWKIENKNIEQLFLEVLRPELIPLVQKLERGKEKLDKLVEIPKTRLNGGIDRSSGNQSVPLCQMIKEQRQNIYEIASENHGIENIFKEYANHLVEICAKISGDSQNIDKIEKAIREQELYLKNMPGARGYISIEQIEQKQRLHEQQQLQQEQRLREQQQLQQEQRLREQQLREQEQRLREQQLHEQETHETEQSDNGINNNINDLTPNSGTGETNDGEALFSPDTSNFTANLSQTQPNELEQTQVIHHVEQAIFCMKELARLTSELESQMANISSTTDSNALQKMLETVEKERNEFKVLKEGLETSYKEAHNKTVPEEQTKKYETYLENSKELQNQLVAKLEKAKLDQSKEASVPENSNVGTSNELIVPPNTGNGTGAAQTQPNPTPTENDSSSSTLSLGDPSIISQNQVQKEQELEKEQRHKQQPSQLFNSENLASTEGNSSPSTPGNLSIGSQPEALNPNSEISVNDLFTSEDADKIDDSLKNSQSPSTTVVPTLIDPTGLQTEADKLKQDTEFVNLSAPALVASEIDDVKS